MHWYIMSVQYTNKYVELFSYIKKYQLKITGIVNLKAILLS